MTGDASGIIGGYAGQAQPSDDWPRCPLCGSPGVTEFALAHGRRFGDCRACRLIHLWHERRLSRSEERAQYSTHRNDPADPGYRAFLSRLSNPLVPYLAVGAEGLDYGSGPGPTLSGMLEEQGLSVRLYDPFFAPNPQALERTTTVRLADVGIRRM